MKIYDGLKPNIFDGMKRSILYLFSLLCIFEGCSPLQDGGNTGNVSSIKIVSATEVSNAEYIAMLNNDAVVKSGSNGLKTLCGVDVQGVMNSIGLNCAMECDDPQLKADLDRWLAEEVELTSQNVTSVYDKYLYLREVGVREKNEESNKAHQNMYIKQDILNQLRNELHKAYAVVVRISDGAVFTPTDSQFPPLSKNLWFTSEDNGETIYFTDKFAGGSIYKLTHGNGDLNSELVTRGEGDYQDYIIDEYGNIIASNYTEYYQSSSNDDNADYVPYSGNYKIIYADGSVDKSMVFLPADKQYRVFFKAANRLYAYVSDGMNSSREDPDCARTYLYRFDYNPATGKMSSTFIKEFTRVEFFKRGSFRIAELSDGRFLLADHCVHQWGIKRYSILCDPSKETYELREIEGNSWSGCGEDGLEYNFYFDEKKITWFNDITLESGERILNCPDDYIWIPKSTSNDWADDDLEGHDAHIVMRGLKKSNGAPVTMVINAADGLYKLIENLDDRQVFSLLRIN